MKYEAHAGDHIEGVFAKMVEMANLYQCTATSEFNGEPLRVAPHSNAEQLYADWTKRQAEKRKAYEESPEGKKAIADAKAAQQLAVAAVCAVTESTPHRWTVAMHEISGFGGGYELACRAMVSAGMDWLVAHPEAKPQFHGYKGITGIITEDNDDAKALSKAIVAASGGDCTGAMHQYSVNHALHAFSLGWPAYVKMMEEANERD